MTTIHRLANVGKSLAFRPIFLMERNLNYFSSTKVGGFFRCKICEFMDFYASNTAWLNGIRNGFPQFPPDPVPGLIFQALGYN